MDSELQNRNKPASKCPEDILYKGSIPSNLTKIRPGLRNDTESNVKVQGTIENDDNYGSFEDTAVKEQGLTHWRDCFPHSIESRHSDHCLKSSWYRI